MFRASIGFLCIQSCQGVLSSMRLATTRKMLSQEILSRHQDDAQDPYGYNSLARTLNFKHPCSAVAYDNSSQKLRLAFNSYAEDFGRVYAAQKFVDPSVRSVVQDYMNYLSLSVTSVSDLQSLIGLVVSKSHAYPLLSLRSIPNKLKRLADKSTEDKKFATVLAEFKHEVQNLKSPTELSLDNQGFFSLYSELLVSCKHSKSLKTLYAEEVLQPLFDVVKVRRLYSSQPINYEVLENSASHHAELAVLKYCIDNNIDLNNIGIGISRLTCFVCHVILEHHGIKDVGTHGLFYSESDSKILEDFFTDDKLCSKICDILNQYIAKHPNLVGVAAQWEDLRDIEKKQLPPVQVTSGRGSESYLLDFASDQSCIDATVQMLGLDIPDIH